MVISTGITVPRIDSVAALYALTSSMMLTPCGPSAVPTGGAGVADAAFKATLTRAAIFFLGGILVGSFFWAAAGGCPQLVRIGSIYDPVGGRLRCVDHTFWTCGNVRSTGVSRPRISTNALSRWLLTLISVMVAWTPANGPSTTMTESPTAKSATSTFLRRLVGLSLLAVAAATTAGASIFSTSSRLSGTGELECPTKPVTDGVWRTVDQDSS